MLNLAICDNNKKHLSYTEKFIREHVDTDSYDIRSFLYPEFLLESVNSGNYAPEILVLDIQLGGMDGIELAKQVNTLLPQCQIIYLTGYPEYASGVYFTDHVFFVVKDKIDKYLPSALEKAVSVLEKHAKSSRVCFKQNGRHITLCVSDILYFERILRKTEIVTADGKYTISSHPAELLGENNGDMFIQCHRSYWVNFANVNSMDANSFTLSNNTKIPISRSRREETKEKFFSLLRS